jgi:two-component system LytT family response regulator
METNFNVLIDSKPETGKEVKELIHQVLPDAKVIFRTKKIQTALHSISEHHPDMVIFELPDSTEKILYSKNSNDKINNHLCIIVVAEDDTDAIRAIENASLSYVTKPIRPEVFLKTVEKERLEPGNIDINQKLEVLTMLLIQNKKIKVNTRNGFLMIKSDNIVYCEADRNYCRIHLTNGKTVLATMQLGKLEKMLNPKQFVRINRSQTININFLDSFNRKSKLVTLVDIIQKYELQASKQGANRLKTV